MNKKLFTVLLAALVLCGCSSRKEFRERYFLMDTAANLTVVSENTVGAKAALKAAEREMKRVELLFDLFDPDSEVSRINAAASKKPVEVSGELLGIIEKCLRFGTLTDGAFDITVLPVMELWGYGTGKKRVPGPEDLKKVLKLVNYRDVILDKGAGTVRFARKGMKLDLNAVADGYAADRAMQVLKQRGIKDALVDIGGELRAAGSPLKGNKWRIGVRHPRSPEKVITVITINEGGVSTSGDYEDFFTENGVRYHHIIDPGTGMPARGSISATVLAGNAADSDILSTALFVIGPEKALKVLEKFPGADIIILSETAGGTKITVSENFKKLEFKYD